MASKKSQATGIDPVIIEETGTRIRNGKLILPSFKYKKEGEKNKRTYAEREIEVLDEPGKIVRVYLDKDDTITTKDGPEHELILGEFIIPEDEYEEVEIKIKGKKEMVMEKKAKDLSLIKIKTFEIPDRS